MNLDPQTAITLAGVLFAGVSAWFAVKYATKENQRLIEELRSEIVDLSRAKIL